MSAEPVPRKSPWKSIYDPKLDIEGRLARLAQFHLEDVSDQRALLSKFGFQQAIFKRRFLPIAIIWVLVLIFLAGMGWLYSQEVPHDFGTAIAAICAFVFGYYQWRSSRHEKSMEDFYSRLNLANQRRESVELVSRVLGQPWEAKTTVENISTLRGRDDHLWTMYVYSELDNLEYVVEKYNLGYMEPRHALRALRTFYQRCLCETFLDRAWDCALFMAYNNSTIQVVEKVCQDIGERRKEGQRKEERRKEDRRKEAQRPQGPGLGIPGKGPTRAPSWTDKAAL